MDYWKEFSNQEINLPDSIIDFKAQMAVEITQTLNWNAGARHRRFFFMKKGIIY